MNLVYNSEHYSVLAYPAQEGVELVDKEGMRVLFLQGSLARRFRDALQSLPEDERDIESVDAFLDDYCVGAAQPIVFQ